MKRLNKIAINVRTRFIGVMTDKRGEGALNTAITILISVVLGALILAGLYALIGDVVLPELEDRIIDMFNYNG